MDQIGALGPGTVERLVLWAKDTRLRGSIDVRGDRSATMYFSAGFIAHIDDGEAGSPTASDDKERVHARLARRLGDLLAIEDGSYVVNRSADLPSDARWLFGPRSLLDSAAEAAGPAGTLTRWGGAVVDLDASLVDGPRLFSDDAVRVFAALARRMDVRELQAELRWSGDRIEGVLDELHRSRVLAPGSKPAPNVVPRPPRPERTPPLDLRTRPAAPPRPSTPAPAVRAAGRDDRRPAAVSVGSSSPPEPAAEGRTRASALRRLIQNLR